MRTLLLFRGAPGCGKSTYIKEHNLEQYVLSADTLRLMCQSAQETPAGQMEISPQNDDVVWEMLFKLLEVRMSHGEFTVIDATNSKTVEMNRYKNLAKQYRYRMYVIDMTDLPIEECKRRNAQREWLKRVPEAAIDKMYARFATQKVPSGVTVLPSTTDVMSDLNYCPNDFNQWKKIHVIGDVHGCYTCLSEYLGEMKDDELYIFVGDYLDRGIENVEVFKFLCDVVNNNRKNVILLEGNHERWLNKWGHDEPVQSEEFANYTRPQLFKAGIDKNTARKIYSRVGQCAYFEYDGKRYFVSHGGLSYLPYFLPFVSADQMIKGVGRYPDKVLADSIRKRLKPYTSFECFGPIVNQQKVEEVETENIWGGPNKMKRQGTPAVRKLYIEGVNPDSFDPNPGDKDAEPTYTEDNISEANAKIAANAQAKKDFDGKAAENDTSWWGGSNKSTATSVNEEEDDWGV